jgi:hypothetical protein
MALKTKYLFAEMVMREFNGASNIGRDLDIDPREIILRLDAFVNDMAKKGFFENWQLGFDTGMNEQYLTRWEWLTVTDPVRGQPSYVQIPAAWVSLPRNMGINQVYFQNDPTINKKKYFEQIIVTSHEDVSRYRNNMASGMEGRLSCYPRNNNLYFSKGNINATYGNIGLSLVVRDASAIADDAPYPVPADKEAELISATVAWFRNRIAQPQDAIKDGEDKRI